MTSVFTLQNSVRLFPASFCTPKPLQVSLDFLLTFKHIYIYIYIYISFSDIFMFFKF